MTFPVGYRVSRKDLLSEGYAVPGYTSSDEITPYYVLVDGKERVIEIPVNSVPRHEVGACAPMTVARIDDVLKVYEKTSQNKSPSDIRIKG
jgi:hypothetical protein